MSSILNSRLPISEILRECDTNVNGFPGYAQCPICKAEMYVARLPDNGGGWYQCSRCSVVGDSITLLAKRHNLDVKDFLRSRRLLNTETYSHDAIEDHLRVMNERKSVVDGWVAISSDRRAHTALEYQVRDLMAQMRLMNLFNSPNWARGAGLLFGVSTNYELARKFPNVPFGNNRKPWIVTPLFSAPNCVVGMAFIDEKVRTNDVYTWFEPVKDGLTFLQRPIKAENIIVSTSQSHAAAIHIMAQNSQALYPPPVVGCTPGSLGVLDHLDGNNIVIWSPQPDLHNFTIARRIGDRARIATAPVFSDQDMGRSVYEHFIGYSVNALLSTITESSVPWLAALKDYVISRANDSALGRLPEQIALTTAEIDKIHAFCRTEEEARIFDNVYRGGSIDISLTLPSGKKVIGKTDGWYRVNHRGEATLLTNAIPVIDAVISYPTRNVLSGHVRVGNSDPTQQVSMPFRVDEKDFNVDWLRTFCNRQCRRFVTITKSLDRDLYDLATRMHQPKIIVGANKLGWDVEANGFVLPRRFYPRNGESRLDASLVDLPHPYEHLPDFSEIELDAVSAVTGISAPGVWAAFLIGLYHVIAPVFGLKKVPTLLYCKNAEHARATAKACSSYLYLPYGTSTSLHTLEPYIEQHDLPVICLAENDRGVNDCVRHPDHERIILATHDSQNLELADLLGYGQVEIEECPTEHPVMKQVFSAILHFMFENKYNPVPNDNPLMVVADLVRKWSRFTFEKSVDFSNDVVTAWRPPLPGGVRIRSLVQQLVDHHFLGMKVQPSALALDKDSVIETPDQMWVPYRGLKRGAASAGMPLPPTNKITQWLRESNLLIQEIAPLGQTTGWAISLK